MMETEDGAQKRPSSGSPLCSMPLTTKYDAGAPLAAVSLSPEGHSVVIGSREVLKVLRIDDEGEYSLVESLRASAKNLNTSAVDVQWHPLAAARNLIATAPTNGAVVLWDLNKPGGRMAAVMAGHQRTVNRVAWSPTSASLLLSASQDGSVKLWDVRAGGSKQDDARQTFSLGKGFAVRDVRVSPFHPQYFATGNENGLAVIWDIRKPDRCIGEIIAHSGPCFAVDWHPEEATAIATGGRDSMVKVWDMDKFGRPRYTVQTIASVARIRWRPGNRWQIASTSIAFDNAVQVWDVARPCIPALSLVGHRNVVTGVVWANGLGAGVGTGGTGGNVRILDGVRDGDDDDVRDEDPESAQGGRRAPFARAGGASMDMKAQIIHLRDQYLVSVSKDGCLINHAMSEQSAPRQNVNSSSVEWTLNNNITTAMESKEKRETADASFQRLGTLLFASDEPVVGHSDAPRPVRFFGAPGVFAGAGIPEELRDNDTGFNLHVFSRLAQQYVYPRSEDPTAVPLGRLCKTNAAVCAAAGQDRLAQIWSLLSTLYDMHMMYKRTDDATSSSRVEEAEPELDELMPSMDNEMLRDIMHLEQPMMDFDRDLVMSESMTMDLTFSDLGIDLGGVRTAPHTVALETDVPELRVDVTSVLMDTLQFYAEQGDVQTCVALVCVFRPFLPLPDLDPVLVRKWFDEYIELLQRAKLRNEAIETLQRTDDEVLLQAHKKSALNACCASCNKSIDSGSPLCSKCNETNYQCGVCHLKVRGVYAWCQGCGHGGHATHMADWFATNAFCPTGCNHRCNIVFSSSPAADAPVTS